MSFPEIRTIDDVLPAIAHKPEFCVHKDSNGFTSIFYNITGTDTFDSPVAKECRGIVFDQNGRIAARPFHKFFNVNEIGATQEKDIQWQNIVRVEPKLDGSQIYFVPTEGKLWLPRTKKSFRSEVAMAVSKLDVYRDGTVARLLDTVGKEHTAIFEYISPDNRVVVPYDETKLVLLTIRENVSGRYWDREEILGMAAKAKWPQDWISKVEPVIASQPLLTLAKEYKKLDVEGWVLVDHSGERYKVKTLPYHNIHRAISYLEPVHILKAWVSGQTDDLISLLRGSKMEDKAKFVEDVVDKAMTHTRKIMEEVKSITSKYPEKNGDVYKNIAMKYKDHPYFSLIMAEARGREPNYTEVAFKKMNESLKNQQDKDLVCEKKGELSRIP
jgi:RNA ligase